MKAKKKNKKKRALQIAHCCYGITHKTDAVTYFVNT